ncbi:MAG TPA: SPOR domain-containing protein [Candidatus Acidoferrum sp.]|nr:SPOR domain-containing protein [Candidatus Acidoferrum sp.]
MLEGRHVIGLFFLMLLFSGVFFTLGYVMGRNQYDGQVRAATRPRTPAAVDAAPKSDPAVKSSPGTASSTPTSDTAAPPSSDWEFYHTRDSKPGEARLKPAPAARTVTAVAKNNQPSKPANASSKTILNAPFIPGGTYTLQVAALTREADALDLATRLQKKKFPAFVLSPQGDKYYRVQVGPYADQHAADAAKKGLEGAGFKAIVRH